MWPQRLLMKGRSSGWKKTEAAAAACSGGRDSSTKACCCGSSTQEEKEDQKKLFLIIKGKRGQHKQTVVNLVDFLIKTRGKKGRIPFSSSSFLKASWRHLLLPQNSATMISTFFFNSFFYLYTHQTSWKQTSNKLDSFKAFCQQQKKSFKSTSQRD